ncbi:MAG: DUF2817 domain-containing protein, partial [Candidatus Aminicenantes bacterium]|nr:DUF2817 domain-containing protein [Candidatus Aminicenantes bacterium]
MKNKKMGILMLLCIGLISVAGSSDLTIRTPAERSGFTSYSQYEEIGIFLSRLDAATDRMTLRVVGRTLPVRNYDARDLYLVILSANGAHSPETLDRSKPTVFFAAAKHGNEQSAKESVLQLVRDLAVGDLVSLLDTVNVLVLPQPNPYGNRFDQRRNEQDLDLNRDQVKLESPESETINRVFVEWMPEVTMDIHEKGDDYYRVSVGCVSNANIHADLQAFSRKVILKEVETGLRSKRITFQEYLITQQMGIDSSAGVTYRPEDSAGGQMMKRYSTSDLNDGRNSPGIYETLSFIQEGASRHDLKTLKDRTRWQYFGIRSFIESTARHAAEILDLVRSRRATLLEKAKTYSENDAVHLRMKYARDPNEPTLTIKKFVRSESPVRGVLKVDKKAGDTLTVADLLPHRGDPEVRIEEELVRNWFPLVEPTDSVPRPLGYIIPGERGLVVETLLKHGVAVQVLTEDVSVEAEVYRVAAIEPAEYDYLPPPSISVIKEVRTIPAKHGDFYVSCSQPAANLIPCLLEPETQYGLIRYQSLQLV